MICLFLDCWTATEEMALQPQRLLVNRICLCSLSPRIRYYSKQVLANHSHVNDYFLISHRVIYSRNHETLEQKINLVIALSTERSYHKALSSTKWLVPFSCVRRESAYHLLLCDVIKEKPDGQSYQLYAQTCSVTRLYRAKEHQHPPLKWCKAFSSPPISIGVQSAAASLFLIVSM